MSKPIRRIDEETAILPNVIAESVVAELDLYLLCTHKRGLIDHPRYAQILIDRAERIYKARPDLRSRFRKNNTFGRDWLYCFMRHWLTAELKDFSQYIPASFANGEPLRIVETQ